MFGRSNESLIPVDVDGWSIEAELSGLMGWKVWLRNSTSESSPLEISSITSIIRGLITSSLSESNTIVSPTIWVGGNGSG